METPEVVAVVVDRDIYIHQKYISNGTTTTATGKTRVETSPYTPQIPSTASKGNNQDNEEISSWNWTNSRGCRMYSY